MSRSRAENHLARSADAEDLEIVGTTADGKLRGADGRRYQDWLSGWAVGNFGWANARLRSVIHRYHGLDYISPQLRYAPWVQLAGLLTRLAPGRLEVAWRATGGTEAVDLALQIAMAATGRGKFIAIEGDYHGNSIGALSVSGGGSLPNALEGCESVAAPLDAKAAARIEKRLARRDVAAFIMEPIVLNLNVEIPRPEFMTRLFLACARTGTLLIMDEVASGFGRTGKLFASEHYGIAPDILCVAKAITGGYAPLGATLTTREVAKRAGDKVSAYSTYGWHPLSTAVAIENLRWIARHRRTMLRHVNALSDYFRERLAAMGFESLRIKGLAIAAETTSERRAAKIAERCLEEGMLVGAEERFVVLFPPLNLSREDAKKGLDLLGKALKPASRSGR